MDNLYTVKQIAFMLKVHPLTIRRYIRSNNLTAVKIAGSVRIKEEDLTNFQKNYQAKSLPHVEKFHTDEAHNFSSDDPIWQLSGRGSSLTLPTDQSR